MIVFDPENTHRIPSNTREIILADFWPDKTENEPLVSVVQSFKNESVKLDAAALCLYSAMLILGIHEPEDEARTRALPPRKNGKKRLFLKPDFEKRKFDAKINPPKGCENLSGSDLAIAINEICMRDTRNCFAHGNFEICGKSAIDGVFVLSPNQSKISSEHKIAVTFANVADVINDRILDYIDGRSPEELLAEGIDVNLEKIVIPSMLLDMAMFYAHQSHKIARTARDLKMTLFVQNAFLATMLTYNESEYHALFGKDSNTFKAVAFIRNSLAHGFTHFENNGGTQKFKNDYKNTVTEIKDRIENIFLKIETLEAQKKAAGSFEEIDNIIIEDFMEQQHTYEELLEILHNFFDSNFNTQQEKDAFYEAYFK